MPCQSNQQQLSEPSVGIQPTSVSACQLTPSLHRKAHCIPGYGQCLYLLGLYDMVRCYQPTGVSYKTESKLRKPSFDKANLNHGKN